MLSGCPSSLTRWLSLPGLVWPCCHCCHCWEPPSKCWRAALPLPLIPHITPVAPRVQHLFCAVSFVQTQIAGVRGCLCGPPAWCGARVNARAELGGKELTSAERACGWKRRQEREGEEGAACPRSTVILQIPSFSYFSLTGFQ